MDHRQVAEGVDKSIPHVRNGFSDRGRVNLLMPGRTLPADVGGIGFDVELAVRLRVQRELKGDLWTIVQRPVDSPRRFAVERVERVLLSGWAQRRRRRRVSV